MNRHLFFFALIGCFTACKKPIEEELPTSLKTMIEQTDNCSCQPYLKLYRWKGMDIYLKGFTGAACNWVPSYFDKTGNPYTMPSGYTVDRFVSDSKLLKDIWHCQ